MIRNSKVLLLGIGLLFGSLLWLPHSAQAAAQGALGGACYPDHQCDGAYVCNQLNLCTVDPNLDLTTPAQNTGATNQAAALTPDAATADWQQCKNSATGGTCQTTVNSVNVFCSKSSIPTVDRWTCDFKYPDGSLVTADPNAFKGATFRNYDSQGNLLGTSDTGFANTSAGTLQGKNLDTSSANKCDVNNLQQCLQNAFSWLIKTIALLFLRFANLLVYLGGSALNWVIYVTIFQFGNVVGNNGGLLAAWGVLRDIGNMLLLFGFIFMGISTILNLPGNEFTAKKALPTFIIFAVLMNFSLFAAEAVIDVSNAFGVTFYKQAVSGGCPSNTTNKDCVTNFGLTASVMQVSGLSTIFSDQSQKLVAGQSDDAQIMIYLMLCVFAMVTAFVFFAAAFMFVARMVVLAIVMVTSPIGFAGMAIPPLKETSDMWWKTLLNQAFFAPIYILLVLISVQFMKGITAALSGGSGFNANLITVFGDSGQSSFVIFIVFCLIIGFMLAAVVVAQQMGAAGSKFATARAAGLTAGSIGFIGRRTIGQSAFRGAEALSRTKFGRTNSIGKFMVGRLDSAGKASFDPRGLKGVSEAAKGQHIDIGSAQKGGFEGVVHAEQEKREKYAKRLENTAEEKQNIALIEERMDRQEKADRQELDEMRERHANEREGLENDIRRLTAEAQAARNRGDAQAQRDAELALNTRQRMLDDMTAKQAQERKQKEDDHKQWMNKQQAEIKRIKNAPKTEYAKSLHADIRNPLDWWDIAGGVGQISGHHAAEKIKKDVNKTEVEKLYDEIENIKKKGGGNNHGNDHSNEHADDHGGGGHAGDH